MYLQCFKSAKQGKKAIYYNYENDIKEAREMCGDVIHNPRHLVLKHVV